MVFKNILYYGFFYSMIMNLKEIGKFFVKIRDVKPHFSVLINQFFRKGSSQRIMNF
jgi:hypothetical protein